MGPFSGSDHVSAVVKLSLFGRKTPKHEPMKVAHPSAGVLSVFLGFLLLITIAELLMKAPSARTD